MRIINLESVSPKEFSEEENFMAKKGTAAFLIHRAFGLTPFSDKFCDRLIATKLQVYVDEWLETGCTDQGEHPKFRSMRNAPDVTKLLRKSVKNVQPRLLFFPADTDLFSIDLCTYIQEEQTSDPVERALKEANRLFISVMISNSRDCLCKCRYCGRYFLKTKFKKTPYSEGIFCSRRHQSSFHAKTHIDSNRKQVTSKLIAFAAKFLIDLGIRDSMWQGDKSRKERLASKLSGTPVCRRLLRTVKANWVTRHQTGIEKVRIELTNPTVTG